MARVAGTASWSQRAKGERDPMAPRTKAETKEETKSENGQAEDSRTKPKFSPTISGLHINAERKVNLGKYESFTLGTLISAERDPNYTVGENVAMLQAMAIAKVNEACDEIVRQAELEPAKSTATA
jgi:hypothetical protein